MNPIKSIRRRVASTEMRACCGRRVLVSVDDDDGGGDDDAVGDVDALVEADARAREALEAAEEVLRVKINVEAALRRGFMALARARWDDGVGTMTHGVTSTSTRGTSARARVRVEGERVGGGGGARALAVASAASGMASPAVREARRAFEEVLVNALEACDAQDALSARVSACG